MLGMASMADSIIILISTTVRVKDFPVAKKDGTAKLSFKDQSDLEKYVVV